MDGAKLNVTWHRGSDSRTGMILRGHLGTLPLPLLSVQSPHKRQEKRGKCVAQKAPRSKTWGFWTTVPHQTWGDASPKINPRILHVPVVLFKSPTHRSKKHIFSFDVTCFGQDITISFIFNTGQIPWDHTFKNQVLQCMTIWHQYPLWYSSSKTNSFIWQQSNPEFSQRFQNDPRVFFLDISLKRFLVWSIIRSCIFILDRTISFWRYIFQFGTYWLKIRKRRKYK